MDLGSLIKHKERTVWAEFRPGFEVELRYLPLAEMRRRLESEERAVVRGGRVQQQGLTAVLENNTAALIVNWRLPAKVAVNLLEVEAEDLAGVAEVPCTEENKLSLIREVHGFSRWLNDMATDLANFRAREVAAAAKNSRKS